MSAAAPAYPEGRAAPGPPESRGLDRDGVRLLVASRKGITHASFRDLGSFLRPGDLLVVNNSATLPAAVDGTREYGRATIVHFSAEMDDGSWVVELRKPDNSGPFLDGGTGEVVELPGGGRIAILSAYRGVEGRSRLLLARPQLGRPVAGYLKRFGRPIAYGYLEERPPLSDYQTIFATEPGGAEMPSAGRPFSGRVLAGLVSRGVSLAPITLHTGVSSPEVSEPPAPERFRVPAATAALANHTHREGGRVVAVGTTVTRALESAADEQGFVNAAEGWTDLVLDASRPVRTVDGLITGWHAASATHLLLLEAVAGSGLVTRAYDAAAAAGYLWHEFGDSCLLLP
ncbi:MAG TPA: S-adenosylmethionine:tRNA ribosyltransferase-isomerase [Actinomycetota bacterium]|nr:S-adenosylmethionine:tRNA ribosyltransferase-isomerase [Actinomycetota bacterium]